MLPRAKSMHSLQHNPPVCLDCLDCSLQEGWEDLKPATNYRVTIRAINAKYGPGPATTQPVRTRGNHDDSHPPGAVLDFDVSQSGTSLVVAWSPPQSGGWASSYEVLVADSNGRRLFDNTVEESKVGGVRVDMCACVRVSVACVRARYLVCLTGIVWTVWLRGCRSMRAVCLIRPLCA
jgi:hypothetical protein